MPLINLCRKDNSPIVHLQRLDSGLIGVVTENDGIYLLEDTTSAIVTHMKIEEMVPHGGMVAFSPDGGYFAFAHLTKKGYALRLIDVRTKSLVRSYSTQENPIELIAFDPSSTYIVGGTATGRVFLWRVDGVNLLARLSSFPEYTPNLLTAPTHNFVSAVAFSDTMIATTGYGGSIVVTNLRTQANTHRLRPGKRRIDALCFMDSKHLISGNEDGLIELMHIEMHHPIRRVPTNIGAIAHLYLLPESPFLLAASKYNQVALINIAEMEVEDNHYITTDTPLTAMCESAVNTMLLGLKNGEILRVELSPSEAFEQLLEEENFKLAYNMGDHEPIIKHSPSFKKMEAAFGKAYDRALQALADGRTDDAKIFLIPYAKVAQKSRHIQGLFNAFDHYPRFRHLIREKKYAAVYGLSVQYPPLQRTVPFIQLEKEWDETFATAQKLIFKGDEKRAKAAFGDFLTVPSKSPLIRLLLHRTKVILDFSKAVHARDFMALKRVTDQDPVLRETPSYKMLMESADEIVEHIMRAIKTKQFDKAAKLADALKQIPHLAHHHAHIELFLDRAQRLDLLFEKEKFQRCYELLDQNSELNVLPQAKKMEKRWEKLIGTCEKAAISGNTALIKETLGNLITLRTRSDKIGNLLRTSYQMQLKYYLTQQQREKMKTGMEQYVFLFGMDNEIHQLIALYNEQGERFELREEQAQHRPRSLWLTLTQGDVPDNIAKFD